MSVRLEATVHRYIGLSSDAKPDGLAPVGGTAQPIPAGSSFLESDTGRIYRWSGEAWAYAAPADESAALLAAMYAELYRSRVLLQMLAGQDVGELAPV